MARKGGKRGGSSAARSAAAKKGWETRRRGGAKAKPAATKRTAASKPRATTASKPTARRGMPKTTSARGRALTNQRRAADLVRASRGGKGPSAKAVRSVLTAQRARAFYAATGGGKKRSAVKAKSAAKVGKSIRAEGRAKATAARAKVVGRPRAGVAGAKTVLNQDRWKRVAQRVKTRGEVRAYIEGKRPEGYNNSTEKRVFAAYQTRQRAEQFLRGLTRNKSDPRKLASGLAELNSNFQSRRRAGTGSTSKGVAARNRIYDEQRRAKRAESKATRERAAAAAGRPRSRVVAATGAKPAAQRPAATARTPRKRVDYAGAVSLGRSQDAARRRLARGEYTATGNGGWSMMWDRRQAKTPTEKLARDRVKASLSELRKWQGTTRNQYASSQMKERAKREIARARKDVIKQVRIARAFRPAYLPETRRRYQASKG